MPQPMKTGRDGQQRQTGSPRPEGLDAGTITAATQTEDPHGVCWRMVPIGTFIMALCSHAREETVISRGSGSTLTNVTAPKPAGLKSYDAASEKGPLPGGTP